MVCIRQEVKSRVLDRISGHVRHPPGKNARSPDCLAAGRDQGNTGWAVPPADLGKNIAHRGCFEPDLHQTGDIRFHVHFDGFGLVPQLFQIRMREMQLVGADTQMVQMESSFGICFRPGAGPLHIDPRVCQSDSQRVNDGPHHAPPPLSFKDHARIAVNAKNLPVRRGDALQGGHRSARERVLGLARSKHPDMPRGYDPGSVREAAKAHRTTGRRVHQPIGHRKIHIVKIHPLKLRRRDIKPYRSRDIRHIPVRHGFEVQPDQFASPGPDPQAVRVEKRIGEKNCSVGCPKL